MIYVFVTNISSVYVVQYMYFPVVQVALVIYILFSFIVTFFDMQVLNIVLNILFTCSRQKLSYPQWFFNFTSFI